MSMAPNGTIQKTQSFARFRVLAVLAGAAISLAACGNSPSQSSSSALTGSLRVKAWSDWTFLVPAANQYMQSHPGVTITVEAIPGQSYFDSLPQTLSSSDAPDITALTVAPGPYDAVLKQGLLADISDIWAQVIHGARWQALRHQRRLRMDACRLLQCRFVPEIGNCGASESRRIS